MMDLQKDMSLIDCLSSPITLLSMMSMLKLVPGKVLHLVLLGASRRAEEFILRHTLAWQEIAHSFPQTNVRLYFVGPEIASTAHISCDAKNLDCFTIKGTLTDFESFRHEGALSPGAHNTLFSVLNGGFGNFAESNRFELLWSWLPDLESLLRKQAPVFLTCANDYGDVKGEVAVMRALGAKVMLVPQENKYSFATTLVGEDNVGWSRGNSFFYAVCGTSEKKLLSTKPQHQRQQTILAALKLEMEWPSTQPPSWGVTHITAEEEPTSQASPIETPTDTQTETPTETPTETLTEAPTETLSERINSFSIASSEMSLSLSLSTQGLRSMAEATLEVFPNRVCVSWGGHRHDTILPIAVDPARASASFSRKKQLLLITLPRT